MKDIELGIREILDKHTQGNYLLSITDKEKIVSEILELTKHGDR